MSTKAIRVALAAAIDNIGTLNVTPRIVSQINPHHVMVLPSKGDYHASGDTSFMPSDFVVRVFLPLTDLASSQDALDDYLDASGGQSIKAAIEQDRTLGGVISDLRVHGWSAYGPRSVDENQYLTADIAVTVYP